MPDQDQPTQQGPRALLEQIDQALNNFLVDPAGTLTCRLPIGDVACPQLPIPVPHDGSTSIPARRLAEYMDAAADHIVRYHEGILGDFAPAPEEVARAHQQVQDREDQDFHTAMAKAAVDMHTVRSQVGTGDPTARPEQEPVWALRPRLRVAEEVSLDDFMTDPEIHARIESEASLPDDIVRAGVEAYERVHPHDRDDAEIIVRKVAAAALLAGEKTREADEQKFALAKYVADQTHITQLLGFLVADEGVYVYRFVDRAQRRIFDYAPPELRGMILSAMFKVLPQEGTSLVILRDHTPPELLPGPKDRDLVVDTLPTVLQVLFGELHSDLTPPGKDGIYVIAVHPDLLPRLDGGDPDAEAPATTEATQEES